MLRTYIVSNDTISESGRSTAYIHGSSWAKSDADPRPHLHAIKAAQTPQTKYRQVRVVAKFTRAHHAGKPYHPHLMRQRVWHDA